MITKNSPRQFVEKLGKECDKCSHCCSYGTGFLEPNDLQKIALKLNMHPDDVKKHYLEQVEMFNTPLLRPKKLKQPYGKCVFLKKDECSIHDAKPLHCKLSNCGENSEASYQWFMLNFAVDPEDPQSVRDWSMYLQFKTPIPGGELKDIVKDKARLKKILDYEEV